MGTAIFNKDKLIGFLSGDRTKDLLCVLNEMNGGLLISSAFNGRNKTPITLEILKSETKTEPIKKNKKD